MTFFYALLCAYAQNEIDIPSASIDGITICGKTVDKITNIFGRPTATQSYDLISDVAGPVVYYHNLGLSFNFSSASDDPKQGVFLFTIHLVKEWDEEYSEFYLPFSGTLSEGVSANQKVDKTKEIYTAANYAITERTPDDERKMRESLPLPIDAPVSHVVEVDFGAHDGYFSHEEVTKFLDRVSIGCSSQQ